MTWRLISASPVLWEHAPQMVARAAAAHAAHAGEVAAAAAAHAAAAVAAVRAEPGAEAEAEAAAAIRMAGQAVGMAKRAGAKVRRRRLTLSNPR